MPYIPFTQKWLYRGLLAASALGILACGDDITKTTEVGRTEFAESFDDLPECSEKLVGEIFFVKETGALYVCADSAWKKAAESGPVAVDSTADTTSDAGCSLKDNGDGTVTQVCGGDSVLLGKAFCGKIPYESDSAFCLDGKVYAKVDGKIYDPELEFPLDGKMIRKSLAWRYRNPNVEYDTIFDSRDGRAYLTVKIGDQVWMAENLNYRGEGSDTLGICMNFGESKCDLYGRYYGWLEAMNVDFPQDTADGKFEVSIPENARGICPEGFRVPTLAEYGRLRTHLDSLGYGKADWIATASNTSGFGLLFGGYYDSEDDEFYDLYDDAYLWSYNPEESGFEKIVEVYPVMNSYSYSYDDYDFVKYRNNLRCVLAQKN